MKKTKLDKLDYDSVTRACAILARCPECGAYGECIDKKYANPLGKGLFHSARLEVVQAALRRAGVEPR